MNDLHDFLHDMHSIREPMSALLRFDHRVRGSGLGGVTERGLPCFGMGRHSRGIRPIPRQTPVERS
jgi:hypothetical protein